MQMSVPTYQQAVSLLKQQFAKLQLLCNQNQIKQKQIQIMQQTLISQQTLILNLSNKANSHQQIKLQLSQITQQKGSKEQGLNTALKQSKNQIIQLTKRIQRLQKVKKSNQQHLKIAHETQNDLKQKNREANTSIKTIKAQNTKLRSKLTSMQQQLKRLKQKLNNYNQQLQQQQSKVTYLQKTVKQLHQQKSNLISKCDGLSKISIPNINQLQNAKKKLQQNMTSLKKQLVKTKTIAVENEIRLKQDKERQQQDLNKMCSFLGQRQIRNIEQQLTSKYKQKVIFVLSQFDKIKSEINRLRTVKKQIQKAFNQIKASKQFLQEQTQINNSKQTNKLTFLKQQNQVLKIKLQEQIALSHLSAQKQSQQITKLTSQIDQKQLHQSHKIQQIKQLQSKINSLLQDKSVQQKQLIQFPKIKLSLKINQYLLAQALRVSVLIAKKMYFLMKETVFYKSHVYYSIKISSQIRKLSQPQIIPSKWKIAFHTICIVKYLWKKALTKVKNKVSLQSQQKLKNNLDKYVECSFLKRVLVDTLTCNQSKNNLQFISSIRQLSSKTTSMSQQPQFMAKAYGELSNYMCENMNQRTSLRLRTPPQITLRISKDLSLLSQISHIKRYNSVQSKQSNAETKKAGKIYGRRLQHD